MNKAKDCSVPFLDRIAAFFSRKLRLVFVPKCILCRDILIYPGEMCPECLSLWEGAKRKRCPICKKSATNCSCLPALLSDTDLAGERRLLSLTFLKSPDDLTREDIAVRRMVYAEKSRHTKLISSFAARELAPLLIKFLAKSDEAPESWRITYPPRTAGRKNRYGFDQGKTLSKYLSKYTGIPTEKCIVRKRNSKMQKTLGFQGRKENARETFRLSRHGVTQGANYFIVDDVITTGASMDACSAVLHEGGAGTVLPVCISRTCPHKSGEKRKPSASPWFRP